MPVGVRSSRKQKDEKGECFRQFSTICKKIVENGVVRVLSRMS